MQRARGTKKNYMVYQNMLVMLIANIAFVTDTFFWTDQYNKLAPIVTCT